MHTYHHIFCLIDIVTNLDENAIKDHFRTNGIRESEQARDSKGLNIHKTLRINGVIFLRYSIYTTNS